MPFLYYGKSYMVGKAQCRKARRGRECWRVKRDYRQVLLKPNFPQEKQRNGMEVLPMTGKFPR